MHNFLMCDAFILQFAEPFINGRSNFTQGTIEFMPTEIVARMGMAVWLLSSTIAFGSENAGKYPNILLITIDTLRADHLSSYGYPLRTSPAIDRLAEEGTRFSSAYSPIPLTGPAHISLLTGRFPQEHGARVNGYAVGKDSKWLFLPQVLKKFGYANAAFISAWPLNSRLTHLDRWFDVYDENLTRSYQVFNSSRYAEDVTPVVTRWLDGRPSKKPFFLWVHYFDPHSPYHLRDGFKDFEQSGHPNNRPGLLNKAMAKRIQSYDSEIGYVDGYVKKLLKKVDDLKLRDSTLVVLTSDHGESLGENGYVGHGRALSQGIVKIPLILRYPGVIPDRQVIDDNVSLLDVMPTLLDFTIGVLNTENLPTAFAGRSLVSAITKKESIPNRPIRYLSFAGKKGWMPHWLAQFWITADRIPFRVGQTVGNKKSIWNPREKVLSSFDLSVDPFEQEPLVLSQKDRMYSSRTKPLSRWFEATNLSGGESRMNKRDMEILRSLGYVQ